MPAVRGCVRIREALDCTVTIVAHVGVSEKAQDRPKGLSDLPGAVDGGTRARKRAKGRPRYSTSSRSFNDTLQMGYEQLARLIGASPIM